jgi:Zn-dependent protease with chaperone function
VRLLPSEITVLDASGLATVLTAVDFAGVPVVNNVTAAVTVIRTWWELWAVVAAGLAGATLAPAVISRTRRTRLPDPAYRDRIADAGIPPERVRVLDADDGVGAFAAGLSPLLGRVFVTEELCRELTPAEVAAVACHEYGHLARRHVPMRLGVPVAFAVAWVPTARLLPYSEFFVGVALLVPTILLSLAINRWTEFDADAFARAQAGGSALASALSRLSAAGHVDDGGRLSRHPRLTGRIERLDGPDKE